jgi:hypothetical protein
MPRKISIALDDKQAGQIDELARLLAELKPQRTPLTAEQIVAGAISTGLQRDLSTVRRMSGLMARFTGES